MPKSKPKSVARWAILDPDGGLRCVHRHRVNVELLFASCLPGSKIIRVLVTPVESRKATKRKGGK